jgi:hypothetical protein
MNVGEFTFYKVGLMGAGIVDGAPTSHHMGVGGTVHREITQWMSKHGTITERTHGIVATPMNLMWAAGAASWHQSSYPRVARGATRWQLVGRRCGMRALVETILSLSAPSEVMGIDPSLDYVAFASDRVNDPRVRFGHIEKHGNRWPEEG